MCTTYFDVFSSQFFLKGGNTNDDLPAINASKEVNSLVFSGSASQNSDVCLRHFPRRRCGCQICPEAVQVQRRLDLFPVPTCDYRATSSHRVKILQSDLNVRLVNISVMS
jgi:hypothetical protein